MKDLKDLLKARKRKEPSVTEENELQYAIRGGAFVRCGRTVKTLEPGFYEPVDLGHAGYGMQPKTMVSDELIDIPGTIADEIFTDIDKFLESKGEYQAYNLTHKRGYLFWGPPGSGKTSLSIMLGNRFVKQAGGVVVYVAGVADFYNAVAIIRDVEPGRPSMYLIEEADTIVNNTHCLSILDGELSIQGAVFVAMTNYKDQLPPRIANRPGRFDRVEKVDAPPPGVQIEYLRRVEARVGKNKDAPEQIVKALTGIPLSLAHLREAFISHILMGVPLDKVRLRFEMMSGLRNDDGDLIVDPLAKMTSISATTDELSDAAYDAQYWEPAEPMKA